MTDGRAVFSVAAAELERTIGPLRLVRTAMPQSKQGTPDAVGGRARADPRRDLSSPPQSGPALNRRDGPSWLCRGPRHASSLSTSGAPAGNHTYHAICKTISDSEVRNVLHNRCWHLRLRYCSSG